MSLLMLTPKQLGVAVGETDSWLPVGWKVDGAVVGDVGASVGSEMVGTADGLAVGVDVLGGPHVGSAVGDVGPGVGEQVWSQQLNGHASP